MATARAKSKANDRQVDSTTPLYRLAGADGVGPLHPLARVAGLKPQPWDGRR